ncbi:MAG TPA: DNA repair protein RecO [Abditibacteriaceae bacterium]|jgi:DNA repair protein RecO (recombination protein O)
MALSFSTRAIVLRTRPLGEKDRIMTLLSPEYGRISAVAKGSRSPKSKQAAIAQPFVLARFLIAPGRSLHISTQSQAENAHTHITDDLMRTAWASYICELCDALPEDQPDVDVFELLETTLGLLDEPEATPQQLEIAGHWFCARFLNILGYTPTIGRCVVSGEKIVVPPDDDAAKIAFSPALGGTLCTKEIARDANRLSVSAGALRALHVLGTRDAPTEISNSARRELREVLRRQLVLHLDTKLKSQKFLDEILALG